MNGPLEERILVLAPTVHDASVTTRFLSQAGLDASSCRDMQDLRREAGRGCGSLLLAEESLGTTSSGVLVDLIARQPFWSDIPIIIVTSGGEETQARASRLGIFGAAGNVTLLERPFRPRTLASIAETALRSRRRQYQVRDLLEERETVQASIRDAFVTLDRQWRYTYVNDKAAFFAGKTKEEMLGKNIWELFPQFVGGLAQAEMQRAAREQGMARFEHFHHRLKRWLEVCVYPSARGVSILSADITDRKLADESVRQAAERFRFMAESIPQKIFTAGRDGRMDYFNEQWAEFSGAPPGREKKGGWFSLAHPEERDELIRAWEQAVETGNPFQKEHRLRRADGAWRWHLTRARAMRTDGEGISMWVGSSTDIDDQKREEEKLERMVDEKTAQLREKVAELEAYSYSISHDMRAPLRVLQGYADILLQDYGPKLDPTAQGYLARISAGAERLDRLVQDVLTYSRVSAATVRLESLDLARLIAEIIEQYPSFQDPRAWIMIAPGLPNVLGNAALASQALSNILVNAIKFVPEGVMPKISIFAESKGHFVRLWIEDNGIGIAPEDQARIFDIFSRVHSEERYEGTGIGLSIVKKAMLKMRGDAGVESEPGQGSRFWLDFPEL